MNYNNEVDIQDNAYSPYYALDEFVVGVGIGTFGELVAVDSYIQRIHLVESFQDDLQIEVVDYLLIGL